MGSREPGPSPEAVAAELAATFWERAPKHDAEGVFPHDNFQDLREAGLLALNVPKSLGGAGLGPEAGLPLESWRVTRAIAFGDPSTAQSYHVHTNEVDIILGLGTPEQQEAFLRPVVEHGHVFGAYGSQLSDSKPTTASWRNGKWVLNGKKFFCTNCEGAAHALIWAVVDGDGDLLDRIQVFYVKQDVPGLGIQRGWWEQFQGQRATGSHVIALDNVEVDEFGALGGPGDYLRLNLQPRAYCQFAASFIGVADRLLQQSVQSIEFRKLKNDVNAINRIGMSRVHIDAAWGLVERAARAYAEGDPEAPVKGNMARYFAEGALRFLLESTLDNTGTFSGSSSSGVSRLLRDVSLYVRHESRDRILGTIGAAELDLAVDMSFSGDNPIVKGARKHG